MPGMSYCAGELDKRDGENGTSARSVDAEPSLNHGGHRGSQTSL